VELCRNLFPHGGVSFLSPGTPFPESRFILIETANAPTLSPITMVRLILFDIDGTLIHTGGAGVKAFAHAFRTLFDVPEATRDVQFAGRTDTSLARELFTRHQIDPSPRNLGEFFDCYVFWLDHMLSQNRGGIFPGVSEFMDDLCRLEQTPAIGLLTGNIRLGAEIKLRHYDIWEVFQTGAFANDHEDRNELAVIARHRAGELLRTHLAGEEILVIGDTPHDVRCARAIGARMLAVATGGSTREHLAPHQPDWLVEDLRQISAREVCSMQMSPAAAA
jgi:phosphoglycolate phosphatase-like HAD superfamily hydrolase